MVDKIILQLLIGIGLILTVFLDYKWQDKRTKEFKISRNILFALTFLVLLISIKIIYDDETERSYEKIERQKQLNSMVDSLSEIKSISFALKQQLEPIIQLAKTRYPNLEPGEAWKMIKKDIDSLQNRTFELEVVNKNNLLEKTNFEKLKRTEPKFTCNLRLEIDKGEVYLTLQFDFHNEVPITYRPSIENHENLDIAPKLFSKVPECYPSKENGNWFKYKYSRLQDLRYLSGTKNIISMTLSYQSVYKEQVPDLKLGGKIIKKYNLDLIEQRLTEL